MNEMLKNVGIALGIATVLIIMIGTSMSGIWLLSLWFNEIATVLIGLFVIAFVFSVGLLSFIDYEEKKKWGKR